MRANCIVLNPHDFHPDSGPKGANVVTSIIIRAFAILSISARILSALNRGMAWPTLQSAQPTLSSNDTFANLVEHAKVDTNGGPGITRLSDVAHSVLEGYTFRIQYLSDIVVFGLVW